jgi:hypothetical protein
MGKFRIWGQRKTSKVKRESSSVEEGEVVRVGLRNFELMNKKPIKVDLEESRIKDKKTALEAIIKLKQSGGNFKGSSIEKRVIRIIGKEVLNGDIAANILRDDLNKERKGVKEEINEISRSLTSDPEKLITVRKEVEDIVTGEKLRPEKEEIDSLSRYTNGDEVEAKKVVKAARNIILNDPNGVRLYKEKEIENSLGETKKELAEREEKLLEKGSLDKEILDREKSLLKRDLLKQQKEEMAYRAISNAGIENQGSMIIDTFGRIESVSKVETNFYRLGAAIGLLGMSSNQKEAWLKENERINSEFPEGVPYSELSSRARASDDVAAVLRKNRKGIFGPTKANFYRFLNGQKKIQIKNGFTQRIRGQPIDKFVIHSMEELLAGNDIGDAMRRIFAGMQGRGFTTSLPNGVSNGLANVSATIGSFLKKSLGDLGGKLGPSINRGIASGANKIGSVLGNAATGLGQLLSSMGGAKAKVAAVAISAGVIITIWAIVGVSAYQQQIMPSIFQSGTEWVDTAETSE